MLRSRFGIGLAGVLAAAIAIPLAAAWAQDAAKAIAYRQGIMKANAWHITPIAAMAKGEMEFDGAALQHHADALAAISKIIVEGFPEGSTADNSKAKPEIWMEWAEFEEYAKHLQEATAALAAAAPTLTKDTLGAALGPVGKACGDCHNEFRAK
ncbi:MAG TPA: cytochrome c [Kiloniellales bacterium]|nr:cytochrome c [Kiloniellales bacterium]